MMLNPNRGNMYEFIDGTWNTVKGECPHNCQYCYMKRWGKQPKLHFDQRELRTDLGKNKFIFVGSSCDMWAWTIEEEWIRATLEKCREIASNSYLFQSKNPQRFKKFYGSFPTKTILATTIETNRDEYVSPPAPSIIDRQISIQQAYEDGISVAVTIEPIMDFDLNELVEMIEEIHPEWVAIGANSWNKIKLPEPPPEKVQDLISVMEGITKVIVKKNLNRIMRGSADV